MRNMTMYNRITIALIGAAWTLSIASAQDRSSLYGPRGVSPEAVRQGILGSCYFHSSIAALAKAAPDTLRNDLGPNPGGGYQVHFTTGPDETVFSEDIDYGREHGFDRSEGDWVLVLMRGYAQRDVRQTLSGAIQNSSIIPAYAKPIALEWLDHSGLLLVAYDRAIRSVVGQDGMMDQATLKSALAAQLSARGIPDAETTMLVGFLDERGFFAALSNTVRQDGEVFGAYKALGQGGMPARVIEAFMGTADTNLVAEHDGLVQQLRRLHLGNMAMVAGTWGQPPDSLANANWWVSGHAYSVLDYDEAAQTVTLRNPWGSHPSPGGYFTLPLSQFLDGFEFYSYSGAQ
jgi:hypothetical protein